MKTLLVIQSQVVGQIKKTYLQTVNHFSVLQLILGDKSTYHGFLQNLINMNNLQLNRLSVLYNKCAHRILGFRSYRMNMSTIFNKLQWTSFPQLIICESLKLVNKINFENKPEVIYNLYHHSLQRSDHERQIRKPSIKYKSLSARTLNSFLHRSVAIYNYIPDKLRLLNKKQF